VQICAYAHWTWNITSAYLKENWYYVEKTRNSGTDSWLGSIFEVKTHPESKWHIHIDSLWHDFTAHKWQVKRLQVKHRSNCIFHLLSYYLANKWSLYVRSQGLEIPTLIEKIREIKITHHYHYDKNWLKIPLCLTKYSPPCH